jgi:hypothetical protein
MTSAEELLSWQEVILSDSGISVGITNRQVRDQQKGWRRVRDSNPRYPLRYAGFQDRCHQPLGQLSASFNRLSESECDPLRSDMRENQHDSPAARLKTEKENMPWLRQKTGNGGKLVCGARLGAC